MGKDWIPTPWLCFVRPYTFCHSLVASYDWWESTSHTLLCFNWFVKSLFLIISWVLFGKNSKEVKPISFTWTASIYDWLSVTPHTPGWVSTIKLTNSVSATNQRELLTQPNQTQLSQKPSDSSSWCKDDWRVTRGWYLVKQVEVDIINIGCSIIIFH